MSRIARNSLYQLVSQGVLLATAVFTTPYIVHRLGADLYGLLVLIGITTNYFGVVELGLGQATIKFMAESYARRDWIRLRQVFWTSSISYLILGTIGAAAIVACTSPLLHFLNVPPYARGMAVRAFGISAVGLIISLQVGVNSSVLRAMERFEWTSTIGVVTGVSQAILTVVLLHFKFSLVGVIAGATILQLGALIAYSVVVWILTSGLGHPIWQRTLFRELAGFGAYVTISQLVGPILVHLEKFMVGSLLAVSWVAYYTVPYSLVNALACIHTSAAMAIFPAFTRLNAEGAQDRARELYMRATKLVFCCLLPVVVVISVFSRQILTVWIGADFGIRSSHVMQILALALASNAIASVPFQFLQAIHRPDVPAKFHIFELVIHIPLCFVLIKNFGVEGAAVAWAIRVILDTVLLVWWASEHIRLGIGKFFRDSFGATLFGAALGAPILIASKLLIQHAGRITTLTLVGITAALYAATVMAIALDTQDKFYLAPLVSRGRRFSRVTS